MLSVELLYKAVVFILRRKNRILKVKKLFQISSKEHKKLFVLLLDVSLPKYLKLKQGGDFIVRNYQDNFKIKQGIDTKYFRGLIGMLLYQLYQ